MTARSVIEHALRSYYADSAEPNAIARELLAQYDAERDEEKATATPAATATPTAPADRIERYITALRNADKYALVERRDDLTRFAEAVIAVANDETDPVYRGGYDTGFIHGGGASDTNRRARLLSEMAIGGRWKSGDVARWYEARGLTGLGVRAARHDLAILRDSGAITQHDEKGVRFYTGNARKGGAR